MKKNLSPGEIAKGLKQFLSKNRDSLTVTEKKLLEECIGLLEQLNNLEVSNNKRFVTESVIQISIQLLKFFTSKDFIELIKQIW
jgi:hypothetical protein